MARRGRQVSGYLKTLDGARVLGPFPIGFPPPEVVVWEGRYFVRWDVSEGDTTAYRETDGLILFSQPSTNRHTGQ